MKEIRETPAELAFQLYLLDVALWESSEIVGGGQGLHPKFEIL